MMDFHRDAEVKSTLILYSNFTANNVALAHFSHSFQRNIDIYISLSLMYNFWEKYLL